MQYLNEIAEILDIKDIDTVNISDNLDELGFDSLASINLISFITDKVDIDIQLEDFENLKTIKDLNDFISDILNC